MSKIFFSFTSVIKEIKISEYHYFRFLVTSEFIRLDQSNLNASQSLASYASTVSSTSNNKFAYYTFQWNCEPNYVLCVFPYVIGFANQCIEVRLLVNGNLVNSITMSNIKLVASKVDSFLSLFNFIKCFKF